MTTIEWSIRECLVTDIPQLYELAKIVFSTSENTVAINYPYEHLYWLLAQPPAGPLVGYVAHMGERVVGFYGVIPIDLYVNREIVPASLSLLTMTHPDYQRQGMFTKLAAAVYELCSQRGIQVTYGFPNANSLPGFVQKLNWTHISTLDIFVRPLKSTNILKGVIKIPGMAALGGALLNPVFHRVVAPARNNFQLRVVERFDARVDDFMNDRPEGSGVIVKRDAKYLNWRYADTPYWKYHIIVAEEGNKLLGYVTLRCVNEFDLQGGMIMDISARRGLSAVWEALVREAVAYSLEMNMDLCACQVHGNAEARAALAKFWFIPVPKRLDIKKWYLGARVNVPSVDRDFLNDVKNWFITFGDDDVM